MPRPPGVSWADCLCDPELDGLQRGISLTFTLPPTETQTDLKLCRWTAADQRQARAQTA